ncbi:hypothetical protein M2650_14015 [Luteimonas sp. SX5]|uniref:Uncharacterized protein n=1 Tax=Luteimonas galliterrae TaxID=2940486 RepID=A0ABT0MLI2_9GAMM|nr:hypothetical protein [Luteimonas galliterrae]MCL1635741.1 hypothetical protein [Luteimonas galliterrae]
MAMKVRYPLIAAALLAALAGAYWLGRANPSGTARAPQGVEATDADLSSMAKKSPPAARPVIAAAKGTSLPMPGTSLKDTFAELQSRAAAGDAAAASRLLRDLDRCNRLRAAEWRNASAADDLTRTSTEGMSAARLRTYQMLLDTMQQRQQKVRDDQMLCDGVGEEMLGTLVANLAQAARLGDKQARACYLERGPLYDARSLLDHPESLRSYRRDAARMIDAGLSAGDWRVVDLLRQSSQPGAPGLLAAMVGADPVRHYRYLKLYRLGAEPHRAAALDRQLAAAAANLTAIQLGEADAWTQTTLRNGFKGHSTSATPPGWDACDF